jgi:glycosyltransferase involved in cell wall biosynthesis
MSATVDDPSAIANTPRRPPRVAIASVGDPELPDTWSGAPAGVFGAMRELGAITTGLDCMFPPGLEQAILIGAATSTRNRYDAHSAALTMALRSLLARRRIAHANVDGVVQIGTDFTLPAAGVPYVTLEDMTTRQGAATHPVFSRMSVDGIAGWERRRARIYDGARMCTAASHWTAGSLISDYGIPSERVAVVGLGATHRSLAAGRVWSPPHFLFVGLDWERKGGPLLLRAFARVREVLPAATLDVVGGHPPISQAGVSAHGVLSRSGTQDRDLMLELFARATCLVVPSLSEPFGIVYLEAGSAGIPSIVSAAGGGRDAIGPDGGAIVQPGDEPGLVDAMLRLSEAQTARRMGEAARDRSELYTWTRVAERLLRALCLWAPDGHTLAEFL